MWTTEEDASGGSLVTMVEYAGRSRGLFEKTLGLLEASNLDPTPAPVHTKPLPSPVGNVTLNTLSLEPLPKLFPLLTRATLLRDTSHSESTPRPLSQEGRAKAKHPQFPLGLVISPLLPHFSPRARDRTPCLTRNCLIWDRLASLGSWGEEKLQVSSF